jgi:hypothetical protein
MMRRNSESLVNNAHIPENFGEPARPIIFMNYPVAAGARV